MPTPLGFSYDEDNDAYLSASIGASQKSIGANITTQRLLHEADSNPLTVSGFAGGGFNVRMPNSENKHGINGEVFGGLTATQKIGSKLYAEAGIDVTGSINHSYIQLESGDFGLHPYLQTRYTSSGEYMGNHISYLPTTRNEGEKIDSRIFGQLTCGATVGVGFENDNGARFGIRGGIKKECFDTKETTYNAAAVFRSGEIDVFGADTRVGVEAGYRWNNPNETYNLSNMRGAYVMGTVSIGF